MVAVDLQRGVGQLEAVAKQFLEVMEEPIVVDAGLSDDVGGEGRKSTGDRPDMQVMHLLDTVLPYQRLADFVGVTVLGRDLQQDPKRLARIAP